MGLSKEVKEILESESRESKAKLMESIVPPEDCKNDAELLKQVNVLCCEQYTDECSLYIDRLSFSSRAQDILDDSLGKGVGPWTEFVKECGVDLDVSTHYGIAFLYRDQSQPFHALCVCRHFLWHIEEVDQELIFFIVDMARLYAELTAACILEQHTERFGLEEAKTDLLERYGNLFTSLSKETRNNLAKANTVLLPQSIFLNACPELVPFYYQRAIESEFNDKVYPRIKKNIPKSNKGKSCEKNICGKYNYKYEYESKCFYG